MEVTKASTTERSDLGDAPDRWHPERIRVEVDGSVVYDSEDYPYDRKSLKAIRLIPPAHLDQDGKLTSNKNHTLREIYVWESGKALGLDGDRRECSSDATTVRLRSR